MLNQDDQYYARMHAALGDKSMLLEWVQPGRVLDVGCGDGLLLDALTAHGNITYGLDATADSVQRATKGGHDVRLGYANNTTELYGENFFDTIICSSVLHEVYAYGDATHGPRQIEGLTDTLRDLYRALKPGGRLLIRDGVKPADGPQVRLIFAPDQIDTGDRLAELYLGMIPFRGQDYRRVDLVRDQPGVWHGEFSSIMEFLYTYTWGEAHSPVKRRNCMACSRLRIIVTTWLNWVLMCWMISPICSGVTLIILWSGLPCWITPMPRTRTRIRTWC